MRNITITHRLTTLLIIALPVLVLALNAAPISCGNACGYW